MSGNIRSEFIIWFLKRKNYAPTLDSVEKVSAELDSYKVYFDRDLFDVNESNCIEFIKYLKDATKSEKFISFSKPIGNHRPRAILGRENYIQFLKEKFVAKVSPKEFSPEVRITSSKNLILFGPPGTGKTYNSIDIAVEIANGGKSNSHAENKIKFDELRKTGQIEFVTFHQNYSYEDFMVGIRPDVELEQLRFRSHRGIFYELAKRAKENYFASIQNTSLPKSFDDAFNEIIQPVVEKEQPVKITTASGQFFTITEVTDSSIHFKKFRGESKHTLSIETLRAIVEGTREYSTGLSVYFNPLAKMIQDLMKPASDGKAEETKNFVIIIDEINRANISKVFGELITLLEEDKRIGQENELKITLPNGEKEFGVPPNLFIIGTMNTADKSISLIDIALRRRFEFIGFYPQYGGYDEEASSLLRKINAAIFEKKKSADYLIGHAYFMRGQSIGSTLENKIIPLLMEYFSGKTEIVSSVFENTGWRLEYDPNSHRWNIFEE